MGYKNIFSRFLLLALCLTFLFVFTRRAAGQATNVELEVFPASVKLPAKGSALATLVVRNDLDDPLKMIRIEHTDVPSVTIEIKPESVTSIPAGSIFTSTLKISQNGSGSVNADVNFQVYYTLQNEGGDEISNVIFDKISVASREAEIVDQVATFTVHSSLSELSDYRPGYIYLEVKNKSDTTLEITDLISAERPDFIILKPSINATPVLSGESHLLIPGPKEIPIEESIIIPLYIGSSSNIRPGKYLLVFNLLYQRRVNGEIRTGSLVAEHELQVKVFGEGEVLGVFTNISSFLILPGFLMLVIFGMMWKLFVPKENKDQLPIQATDARFWVIAIALSLLMAWQIYPLVTSWVPAIGRRDYLYGYGFQDIIWMWLITLFIGTFFALLAAVGIRLTKWFLVRLAEIEERKTGIKRTDSPVNVLEKIINQGYNQLRFEVVNVKATKQTGYCLESAKPGKTQYWIAPPFTIFWHEDDKAENGHSLRDEVADLINQDDAYPGRLLEVINQGRALGQGKGIKNINWTPRSNPPPGEINGLHLFSDAELNFTDKRKSIVNQGVAED